MRGILVIAILSSGAILAASRTTTSESSVPPRQSDRESRRGGPGFSAAPQAAEPVSKPVANVDLTKITVGHYPQGIAFTPGAVWVAFDEEKQNEETGVFRLDPSTNQVVSTVRTGKSAGPVAASEGMVWVGNFGDSSVTRIDAGTNRIVATIAVGKYPFGLDFGEGSVWVTNAGSDSVSRIDAKTNAVVSTIAVGKRPAGVAVGDGVVWVANSKSKSLSRIDPKTNAVVATIKVHEEPLTLTAHGMQVWVSCQSRAGISVLRIDGQSNQIVAETAIGSRGQVGGSTLLDGALWVADRANGTLWKIDVQNNTVAGGPIPVGLNATILGVGNDGNGAIWLSNSSSGIVSKIKP